MKARFAGMPARNSGSSEGFISNRKYIDYQ
jgi:hypothetical protein